MMKLGTTIKGLCPGGPVTVSIDAPLVETSVAAIILGCTMFWIDSALEEGKFRFVWNVGGKDRHAARFLTQELLAIQQGNPALMPKDFDAAESLVVPVRPVVRHEACRIMSMSVPQFKRLMNAGVFAGIPQGRNRFDPPNISPDSVKNFLAQRRLY